MYRHLFRFRRLLATSFLLVFVNVFVGQCWCAVLNPVPAAGSTVAARPAHPGCKGHGGARKAHRNGHGRTTGAHDCCKDKSATVLAALARPTSQQWQLVAPALLPAAADAYFRPAAGQWRRAATARPVPRWHWPPKIPDIRVFIQSLTV